MAVHEDTATSSSGLRNEAHALGKGAGEVAALRLLQRQPPPLRPLAQLLLPRPWHLRRGVQHEHDAEPPQQLQAAGRRGRAQQQRRARKLQGPRGAARQPQDAEPREQLLEPDKELVRVHQRVRRPLAQEAREGQHHGAAVPLAPIVSRLPEHGGLLAQDRTPGAQTVFDELLPVGCSAETLDLLRLAKLLGSGAGHRRQVSVEIVEPGAEDAGKHLQETLVLEGEVEGVAETGLEGPRRLRGLPFPAQGRRRGGATGDCLTEGLESAGRVQEGELQEPADLPVGLLDQELRRPPRHHRVDGHAAPATRGRGPRGAPEDVGGVTAPAERLHRQAVRVAQQQVQQQQPPHCLRRGLQVLRLPRLVLLAQGEAWHELEQQQSLVVLQCFRQRVAQPSRSSLQSSPLVAVVGPQQQSGHRGRHPQVPRELRHHLLRLQRMPRGAELQDHGLLLRRAVQEEGPVCALVALRAAVLQDAGKVDTLIGGGEEAKEDLPAAVHLDARRPLLAIRRCVPHRLRGLCSRQPPPVHAAQEVSRGRGALQAVLEAGGRRSGGLRGGGGAGVEQGGQHAVVGEGQAGGDWHQLRHRRVRGIQRGKPPGALSAGRARRFRQRLLQLRRQLCLLCQSC
mmetsp:Transcript_14328/g.41032  ORF Transcript_14328/g.41032 Transcript_14328/m.41032 type:complete len:624 (+) Transcript_14328:381-2252(+)